MVKKIIESKKYFNDLVESENQINEIKYIFKAASELSFFDNPYYDGYIGLLNTCVKKETNKDISAVLFDWENVIISFKNNKNKSLKNSKFHKLLDDLFDGYPKNYWESFISSY